MIFLNMGKRDIQHIRIQIQNVENCEVFSGKYTHLVNLMGLKYSYFLIVSPHKNNTFYDAEMMICTLPL